MSTSREIRPVAVLLALLTVVALIAASLPIETMIGFGGAAIAERDARSEIADPCCAVTEAHLARSAATTTCVAAPADGPQRETTSTGTAGAVHTPFDEDCCPSGHDDCCPPGCQDCLLACCGGPVSLAEPPAPATEPRDVCPGSVAAHDDHLSAVDRDGIDHPPRT